MAVCLPVTASKKPSKQSTGKEWRGNYLLATSSLLSLIGPVFFPFPDSTTRSFKVDMSEAEASLHGSGWVRAVAALSQQA